MSNEQMLRGEAEEFRQAFIKIRDEVGKVMVGQERVVRATLTAIFFALVDLVIKSGLQGVLNMFG